MQNSPMYAKINNVCKNHKGMQNSQTYAKFTNVCKNRKHMQHKLKAIPYYNFRNR